MSAPETGKSVPAVENAIRILRHLAQSGVPMGVAPLARATKISVSTTFNILKTLSRQGFVAFAPATKTYTIGIGVLDIVGPVLGANPNDLIRPIIEEISASYGIMIALTQLTEDQRMVLIDSVTPEGIVHVNLAKGARLPAMMGAIGRCYTAATNMDRQTCADRFRTLRWNSDIGIDRYWSEVEDARRDGYAFDFGDHFTGLSIASSIVCDNTNQPRLGLSAMTIQGQISRERLLDIALSLRDAAKLIEGGVFGRPRSA